MALERDAPRDWHRLYGLLLIDFFTGSSFLVEVERDMSQQQQFLDVVIVRRGRERLLGPLPDGMDGLVEHNLVTLKSHHEPLDSWAMKELIGHYVAYRKLVSLTPSLLLPESQFRLYVICARFPHNLSGQAPWHELQTGVYDCQWGTDTVRVIVASQLPHQSHNAPLLLFSASRKSVKYAQGIYRQRSHVSGALRQLLDRYAREGIIMPYTWEDFDVDYIKEHFPELTPDKQREVLERLSSELRQEMLQSLPIAERLAGLSPEQIRQYLEQMPAPRPAKPRKPKRKK